MLYGADRFLRSLWAGLHPAPQHFSHAPGLRHAATGRKRLFGIEDLADGANTGFAEMRLKAVQEASGSSVVIWINLEPGVNKGTHEPGPDSALVIGPVAGTQVAVVACLVLRMVRCQ